MTCRGQTLVTGSGDATLKIWDLNKGIATATLKEHTQSISAVNYHDVSEVFVSGSLDHTLKLWDAERLFHF